MNPQQPSVSYNTSYSSSSGSGRGSSLLVVIILSLLLVSALIFGFWAFSGMQDYKNNVDKKIAVAVESAKKEQAAQLQAQFDEASKNPNKTFRGSPTYGSVTFNYPKTWSAYVDTSNSSDPIDGYFHPDQVPALQGKTAFALRVELTNNDYDQSLQQYDSAVSSGNVKSKAYIPPKMKSAANVVPGVYLTGQLDSGDNTQNGAMVIMRVRDKTLKIYTESTDYLNDFDNTVLASLTFSP